MKARITKRSIDNLRPTTKDQFLWDTDLLGFGIKVTPKGKKVYIVQYRRGGPAKRYTIGPHGPWTPETARKEAQRVLGKIASGEDPTQAKIKGKSSPTLKAVGERYLTEHAAKKKKPSSAAEDRRNLNNHVYPVLGSRPIKQISYEDIERLHHSMHKTPYAANRTLSLLSMVFKKAEKWKLREKHSNPCWDVERFKEQERKRYLRNDEFARLGSILTRVERETTYSPSVFGAIRLLIFTGARLNEVLTLKWDYFDRDRHCLNLPDSKTGDKTVYLNTAALEVLDSLPRLNGNPYVLPGQKPGAHLVNLHKPWSEIRNQAEQSDVRLHDIRHSFGRIGGDLQLGQKTLGDLLGHRQSSTTERYTHLSDDVVKHANEAVGENLESLLSSKHKKPARVLPFKPPLRKKI